MESFRQRQVEAAEAVRTLLALPMPSNRYDLGLEEFFNPWSLFPLLYGSYSSEFDDCAIATLKDIHARLHLRQDLASEMIREMLCNIQLCDYGTSPRFPFPTPEFEKLLPTLIERWEEFSKVQWSEES